ncbi:hypothetical protein EWM64_g1952 [Hericium alpestre]|uniref:Bacterial surface antigen (D15) domain-containing protein n=1 Tax=Hericium alpestre TaxID=135208 RepID=A0A4Z0A6U2_9AGAM|nr:hypothetical protein EWM64_g1952 [Hericium alpestre]
MDDPELQDIRARHEARIARKLKGEYESAVLHLADLVNNNLETPARLASVRIDGATHTRKSFLASLIDPHITPFGASDTSTFGSVLRATRDIGHLLQKTDIFSSVNAKLEPSRDPLALPGDVDLTLLTRERGRLYLKTSTEVGNSEGNASATARVRNAFGGAETFEANVSVGTKTRRSFQASLSAPLTATLDTYGDLSVFAMDRDNSAFASCTEGLRGVKAVIRRGTRTAGQHEIGYEGVFRHIAGLVPSASIRSNSMGPRDAADSLGGDLFWATGFSLISDIPGRSHWPLKSHLFLNAGQLHPREPSQSFRQAVTSCVTQPSISAGVGIIYAFDPVRVELNFGVPLVATKSDGIRKGLQFGMGLEFL